jgi:hypothetical protein
MPKKGKFINKNNNFIETGSLFGEGIQIAIESGFEKVISFEIDETLYNHCIDRYKDNPNVEIILGDSAVELKKFLDKNKNISFTYWLDGHYSGGITGCGVKEFPIIEELEAILQRDVKDEVIYIDDMRILRSFNADINLSKIKKTCLSYKPECKISFEPSDYDSEDILIIEY